MINELTLILLATFSFLIDRFSIADVIYYIMKAMKLSFWPKLCESLELPVNTIVGKFEVIQECA